MSLKIIIGISGGVDSAVTALLLKQQGHDVQAVFMQNWQADQDDPYCTAEQDLADAEQVCKKIDIPLHTVNFSNDYWNRVFVHFLDEYAAGRTPNPDILCNKEIKFSAFLDYALSLGADYIATGHYARKNFDEKNNLYQLLKSIDTQKDQSYFLHALNQKQLSKSLFPIGDLDKATVRNIAKDNKLINYNKKDSTGICFIGERKFKNFLSEYLLAQPGNILTLEGEYKGKHQGLMFYTLGQRQGLGIGGSKTGQEPWYVINKDIKNNILLVGQGHDHPALFNQDLICEKMHWISGTPPTLPFSCTAKTRYRQADQACVITSFSETKNNYQVKFTQAQRAITPGQYSVFYTGDACLGGGVII